MDRLVDKIEEYKESLKLYIEKELQYNGSFQEWYEDLNEFRYHILDEYVAHKMLNFYLSKYKFNKYGDRIDHHISSYFAPFDFKRTGFNNEKLSPINQIQILSNYFKSKGSRFIYVCLPNKGFIYPSLICSEEHLYNKKTMVAPQWRKYVYDIADTDVEIIDIYPVFKNFKGGGFLLKTTTFLH